MDIVEIKHYTESDKSYLEVNHEYIGRLESCDIEIMQHTDANIHTSVKAKIFGDIVERIYSDCLIRCYIDDCLDNQFNPIWVDDYFDHCLKNSQKTKKDFIQVT